MLGSFRFYKEKVCKRINGNFRWFFNKFTDDSNDENLEKAEDEKTSPGA